jgi:hypothetical protein
MTKSKVKRMDKNSVQYRNGRLPRLDGDFDLPQMIKKAGWRSEISGYKVHEARSDSINSIRSAKRLDLNDLLGSALQSGRSDYSDLLEIYMDLIYWPVWVWASYPQVKIHAWGMSKGRRSRSQLTPFFAVQLFSRFPSRP